jgi:hypothetical protein
MAGTMAGTMASTMESNVAARALDSTFTRDINGASGTDISRATHRSARESDFFWLASLFLLPAVPLLFLGYGSDNDIYQELDAARSTWTRGIPAMSRHPGYWLHEALIFELNRAGGSLLINGVTLLVALFTLYRFWMIALRLRIAWPMPIALCLAWNPWYLIASTSGIDYIWAVLFVILSIEAFVTDNGLVAGLLGGIAAGLRLGSIFTLAGAYVAVSSSHASWKQSRRLLATACLASAIAVLFYLPSWMLVGRNLSFLQPHMGDQSWWTLKMQVGRALYKPLYLMGILADVYIALMLLLNLKYTSALLRDQRAMIRACLGAVFATLLLFARYPIEISYLLPALPFLLLVVGCILRPPHAWQPWGLVIASLSLWFLSFPLATPNIAGKASDATPGLHVESGILLNDIKERRRLIGCDSLSCFGDRTSSN